MTDHEMLAQREAELWLEQCLDADEGQGGELFCGCTTCIVREVLTAATPHLYAALIELLREHDVDVPAQVERIFADQ